MKHIILFSSILLLSCHIQSCCKQYTAGLNTSKIQSDSTLVVERLRTDTVTIPGDTITIEIPIWQNCIADYSNTATVLTEVKGKRSKASAKLTKDGKLNITLNCDEYRTALIARDSLIRHMQNSQQTSVETKVVERKYIPQIFWWSMVFSCCVLVWWLAKLVLWAYSKWPV